MNRVSRSLILLGLSAAALCAATLAKAAAGNWEVARIADSTIYFKNGQKVIANGLYDVKYIGQLKAKKSSQVLIFSGKDCQNCCANNAVFIFSPDNNKIITPELAPFDYPGTEYDPIDSTMLYKSRMFYGNVLPGVENGIIWYQDMLTDFGNYQRSVYLIKLEKNKVSEQLIFENPPAIENTMKLLAAGKCFEVPAVDYVTEY